MREDGVPFTIMHKCEDLLGFCEAKGMHFVHTNYKKERIKLQGLFGRTGEIYDFGPTPVVWGTEVWANAEEDYLDKNNVCLAALILKYPSELLVYGEALLEYKPFPIRPKEPLFKVFHYREQFEALEDEDKSEATLSKNYLGIVLQSNWNKNAGASQFNETPPPISKKNDNAKIKCPNSRNGSPAILTWSSRSTTIIWMFTNDIFSKFVDTSPEYSK